MSPQATRRQTLQLVAAVAGGSAGVADSVGDDSGALMGGGSGGQLSVNGRVVVADDATDVSFDTLPGLVLERSGSFVLVESTTPDSISTIPMPDPLASAVIADTVSGAESEIDNFPSLAIGRDGNVALIEQ